MINLITIFGTSFIIALSGALMPGPLLTVTISESAQRGAWTGPQLIAGHAVLELIMVFILLLGIGPFLQSDTSFIIISTTGAVVMLWMAVDMFKSIPSIRLLSTTSQQYFTNPFITGFMMSLINPYWVIWWAAIGLGYVTYSMAFGLTGLICFFTGHISADLAWYTLVSFSISKGKKFMNDSVYKLVIGFAQQLLQDSPYGLLIQV
jgi:threonine/homoserine/homoserine lactone efflux protein